MDDHTPALDAKVLALRRPSAYADAPSRVEAIETHMSWVFLTPEFVYKLKKPVRADGLDFSTVERRRFFCEEELRLNRRLAPWVYLDVLPLRDGGQGELRTFGDGRTVDWLVLMRRLSAELMLDHLLARGLARPEHLQRVAAQLCAFHGALAPAQRDAHAYRDRLTRDIGTHEARLCDPEIAFDGEQAREVAALLRRALQRHAAALAERVRAGRVVEGHGDLRPEHVWLGEPPAIIDCLEFSLDLRTADTADEVGFLALECERAEAPALANVLLDAAARCSGDTPPAGLVDFYQGLRALVRAGIALQHLREPRYRGSPVWRERTAAYLALATGHAARSLRA